MYRVEQYYPHVVAILIASLFYAFHCSITDYEKVVGKIMETSLSICGTLLGFLLTILTIINSIETRRMRFIRDSGNYPLLMKYLRVALFSNIVCISVYFIAPIVM